MNNSTSNASYTEKSNFSCCLLDDTNTELDVSSAYQLTSTIQDSSSEKDYDELDDELNKKAYLAALRSTSTLTTTTTINTLQVENTKYDDDDDQMYRALRRMSNVFQPLSNTNNNHRLSIIPFQPNMRKQLTSVLNKTLYTNGSSEIQAFEDESKECILDKKYIRCIGTSLKNCDWSDVITLDIDAESTLLPLMCKLMIIIQGACLERGQAILVRDAGVQVSDKRDNLNEECSSNKINIKQSGISGRRDSYYRRQSFHHLPEYTSIPYYQYQTVKRNECNDVSCNTDDFYVQSNSIFILNDNNKAQKSSKKLNLNVIEEVKHVHKENVCEKVDVDEQEEEVEIRIPIEIERNRTQIPSKFKRKTVLFGEKINRFEAEITLYKLKDAKLEKQDTNADNKNKNSDGGDDDDDDDVDTCKCNPLSYSYHYHQYPNKIITLKNNSSLFQQQRKSVTHVYINHLVNGNLV